MLVDRRDRGAIAASASEPIAGISGISEARDAAADERRDQDRPEPDPVADPAGAGREERPDRAQPTPSTNPIGGREARARPDDRLDEQRRGTGAHTWLARNATP